MSALITAYVHIMQHYMTAEGIEEPIKNIVDTAGTSPWGIIAPWGIVGIAIIAIVRGDLIPKSQVDRIIEVYKEALAQERKTSDSVTVTLDRLIEQSSIAIEVLKALPKHEDSNKRSTQSGKNKRV